MRGGNVAGGGPNIRRAAEMAAAAERGVARRPDSGADAQWQRAPDGEHALTGAEAGEDMPRQHVIHPMNRLLRSTAADHLAPPRAGFLGGDLGGLDACVAEQDGEHDLPAHEAVLDV